MASSADVQDDCSTGSEDEWILLSDLIHADISTVHSAGSFATFGSLESFVLPGLVVDGIGDIGLPLSAHDAKILIRASRQAPFGQGNRTLVDKSVRDTWEINGDRVSFLNKAWTDWLQGIVSTMADNLGVSAGGQNVRAELHKMLLYEKGAMFKPHREYAQSHPDTIRRC